MTIDDAIDFGRERGYKVILPFNMPYHVLLPLGKINGKEYGLAVQRNDTVTTYMESNGKINLSPKPIKCYHFHAISKVVDNNGKQFVIKVNEDKKIENNNINLIISYLNRENGGLRPTLENYIYQSLWFLLNREDYTSLANEKMAEINEKLDELKELGELPGLKDIELNLMQTTSIYIPYCIDADEKSLQKYGTYISSRIMDLEKRIENARYRNDEKAEEAVRREMNSIVWELPDPDEYTLKITYDKYPKVLFSSKLDDTNISIMKRIDIICSNHSIEGLEVIEEFPSKDMILDSIFRHKFMEALPIIEKWVMDDRITYYNSISAKKTVVAQAFCKHRFVEGAKLSEKIAKSCKAGDKALEFFEEFKKYENN